VAKIRAVQLLRPVPGHGGTQRSDKGIWIVKDRLDVQAGDGTIGILARRIDLDRFHLAMDVIDRLPELGARSAYVKQELRDKLVDHRRYIEKYGDDLPEIREWKWGPYSQGETK